MATGLDPVPILRICGAIPPLPHIPSCQTHVLISQCYVGVMYVNKDSLCLSKQHTMKTCGGMKA